MITNKRCLLLLCLLLGVFSASTAASSSSSDDDGGDGDGDDMYNIISQRFVQYHTVDPNRSNYLTQDVHDTASVIVEAYNNLQSNSSDVFERTLTNAVVTDISANSTSSRRSLRDSSTILKVTVMLFGSCRGCRRDARLVNRVHNARQRGVRRLAQTATEPTAESLQNEQNRILNERKWTIGSASELELSPTTEAAKALDWSMVVMVKRQRVEDWVQMLDPQKMDIDQRQADLDLLVQQRESLKQELELAANPSESRNDLIRDIDDLSSSIQIKDNELLALVQIYDEAKAELNQAQLEYTQAVAEADRLEQLASPAEQNTLSKEKRGYRHCTHKAIHQNKQMILLKMQV